MLLLPAYLWLFVGGETLGIIEVWPFAEAFLVLIVVPLVAAGLTQWAPWRWALRVRELMAAAMVPLMMATLAVVAALQMGAVSHAIAAVVIAVPVFVAFAVVMVVLVRMLPKLVR